MKRIIVAAAVLRHGPGAKVLLTQRLAEAHLGGFWEFPGGKVEPGEDPKETVRRECLEECGLDLTVEDILDVAWHRYETKEVLLLFYDCRPVGDARVSHLGVADHAWVKPNELRRFELPPPDEALITKLERGL